MDQTKHTILTTGKPKGFGIRHVQVLLVFLGSMTTFIIRCDISVGIVAMTTKEANSKFETFDWDESTKGLILSSLLWGFIVTTLPGGFLTQKFGVNAFFLIINLGSAILTILTPFIAKFGWLYVCILRFSIGLCQGPLLSCCHILLANWVHPSERALGSIALTGASCGVFIITIISGEIASSSIGWPGIYYTSAGFGFLWSILWICFGSESPSKHKRITDDERLYLEEGFGSKIKKRQPLPLKEMFTSPPFLSILAANGAYQWGFFILLMEAPSYLANNLNYNIKSSAILSALPYIISIPIICVMGLLSDFLSNHQYLTRSTTRKMFNTIGEWIPMICLIALGFITRESANVAVILLITSIASSSGVFAGCFINSLDIAPNFVGPMAGIMMFSGNALSLLGPIFVGLVVTDQANSFQWRIVFFLTAGMYFIGNSLFIIFGKATVQHWNGDTVSLNKKNIESYQIVLLIEC